ncbi:MAG: hypothetical protein ABIG89_04900 [Candidatus Woesearchaeota archaeon]
MNIHGIIFIIVGAIVLGISLFKEELLLFRYLGGAFILYGTFKWIFKLITGGNSKKDALDKAELYRRYGNRADDIQQTQQRQQNQLRHNINRTQMYRCRCGNDVFPHNTFCSNCGIRLR